METKTKTVVTHVTYRRPAAVRVQGVSRYHPLWIDREIMSDLKQLMMLLIVTIAFVVIAMMALAAVQP